MSGSSSYNAYESEEENSRWLLTSETSYDDDLSDELTLLNGDEECDEDTLSFEALIQLTRRLKKQYNLRDATVELERCDKIWNTMQLLKKIQMDEESESVATDEEEDNSDKEQPSESSKSSCISAKPLVPYIKYQPMQGNGNNALPNFYLAVKSQKKLYNCLTCGKQYGDKRGLLRHSQRDHGVVLPMPKRGRRVEAKATSQDSTDNTAVKNSSTITNEKLRLSGTSKQSSEQNLQVKGEKDTTPHPSPVVPKEESKPTTEEVEKPFRCVICDSPYQFQRGMTRHMMKVHSLSLSEARKLYKKSIASGVKPLLKNNSREETQEKRISQEKKEATKEKSPSSSEDPHWPRRRRRPYRYVYTCKCCSHRFGKKHHLRIHLRNKHNVVVSSERSPVRRHGSYTSREYEFYKSEVVRVLQRSRSIAEPRRNDRPRRSCTINNSNTASSKEQEPLAESPETVTRVTRQSSKPALADPNTICFLCKEQFDDIRTHLVEYHRISSPETILPLTTATKQTVEATPEVDKTPVERQERGKRRSRQNSILDKDVKLSEIDDNIRELRVTRNGVTKFVYECVVCTYRFLSLNHIKRHIERRTVDGKLQHHTTAKPTIRQSKSMNSHLESITDLSEPSESPRRQTLRSSKKVTRVGGRKRRRSSKNDRRSSGRRSKRRKLDEAMNNDPRTDESQDSMEAHSNNDDSSSTEGSDSLDPTSNNKETETNPRGTRDSSDRDSGIGISITIKKRNNSYEVVDKDSGDDDKSKDSKLSKSDNNSLGSNSDSANVIFDSDDQEQRRREILESLDSSAEGNLAKSSQVESKESPSMEDEMMPRIKVVKSLRVEDDESPKLDDEEATRMEDQKTLRIGNVASPSLDDDESPWTDTDNLLRPANEDFFLRLDMDETVKMDCDESERTDNVEPVKTGNDLEKFSEDGNASSYEMNFREEEKTDYSESTTTEKEMPQIPSLKVMCRTVLTCDAFNNENQMISHQCPVCSRFYPTDREVSVHMLEHRVN